MSVINKVNCLLNYSNITSEQLNNIVQKYKEDYTNMTNDIIMLSNEDLSWANLVDPFIKYDNMNSDISLLEMKDLHVDKDIRDICTTLNNELNMYNIEHSMRRDLYEKYKHYMMNQYIVEKPFLSAEMNTYFMDIMENYKLMGMELMNKEFEELKDIKKEIVSLCNTFQQNLGEENYTEYLTPEELDGLPSKYISDRLENNMVKVSLKYPDYIPIMEYANNKMLRKRFMTLFKSRCIKENTVIINKVMELRQKMALVLGYSSYADYKLKKSMAKTKDTVNNFLLKLSEQIKPLLQNDLAILSNMHGDIIEQSDVAYYSRIHIEKTCDFNKEDLKQYFPVDTVISGAFNIYQQLLGFKFEKQEYSPDFWHESVTLYKVVDTTCMSLDPEENIMGYFYLDLYPREGKFSHAACFPFITKSQHSHAIAAMVCNFGKDNLTFDEVETFFHEFGHVMHHMSSRATISNMASFSCEHDFVETPSQMFEEWCYMPETLSMMSKDIPLELITKLNQSRKLFQGYHYARQLVFGFFDIIIHSDSYKDKTPDELFSMVQKDILKLDTIPGTSEPATFGHIMGGYDAGYYGYAWSLVYAKDMFSMFKDKLLDQELGLKLREMVLSQGSLRPSAESVKLFLGREPSNMAFIDSIM
jgi:thimet oligopeptidase